MAMDPARGLGLTPREQLDLARTLQRPLREIFEAMGSEPDNPAPIFAVEWLVARRADPGLTFATFLGDVTLAELGIPEPVNGAGPSLDPTLSSPPSTTADSPAFGG